MKQGLIIRTGIFIALSVTASVALAQTPRPTPVARTNGPPAVRIVTPAEGQEFLLGQKILICARSQNFTDAVVRVEFFADAASLGVVTNASVVPGGRPNCAPGGGYSCLVLSNAAVGPHTLTVEATDKAGNSVTSAPVDITVTTNLPPVIRVVKPQNGAVILGPTNVTICASAFDPDGLVKSVEFFQGTTSLGVVTNPPPVWVTNAHGVFPIRQAPYCLTWSNAAPGDYALTAVAADDGGATATSEEVHISIVTNLPPVARITQPMNGARFYGPADIRICAVANDPDGTVTSVEFFNGTTSLGTVTSGTAVTNRCGQVQVFYCLAWSNVPPATYTLTAVATDNAGVTGASASVTVTVLVPPPPAVAIVYPPNGARSIAPANIFIASATKYFTHPIAAVEFLAGTNVLGVMTNSSWPTFPWKNVQAGAYALTAVATDTGGISATSAPVNITVVTNRPAPPPAPPIRVPGP